MEIKEPDDIAIDESPSMINLAADTSYGVYTVDPMDGIELMKPADFLAALKSVDDGETIFCRVSENDEVYKKILADYGIRF